MADVVVMSERSALKPNARDGATSITRTARNMCAVRLVLVGACPEGDDFQCRSTSFDAGGEWLDQPPERSRAEYARARFLSIGSHAHQSPWTVAWHGSLLCFTL